PSLRQGMQVRARPLPPHIPRALPTKVNVPRSFLQKMVAWVCVASLALAPLLALASFLLPVVIVAVFAVWWWVLELAHKADTKVVNRPWEEAKKLILQEKSERERTWQAAHAELTRAEHSHAQSLNAISNKFASIRSNLENLKHGFEGLQVEY